MQAIWRHSFNFMHCTALYCAVLRCTALYCTDLHHLEARHPAARRLPAPGRQRGHHVGAAAVTDTGAGHIEAAGISSSHQLLRSPSTLRSLFVLKLSQYHNITILCLALHCSPLSAHAALGRVIIGGTFLKQEPLLIVTSIIVIIVTRLKT